MSFRGMVPLPPFSHSHTHILADVPAIIVEDLPGISPPDPPQCGIVPHKYSPSGSRFSDEEPPSTFTNFKVVT